MSCVTECVPRGTGTEKPFQVTVYRSPSPSTPATGPDSTDTDSQTRVSVFRGGRRLPSVTPEYRNRKNARVQEVEVTARVEPPAVYAQGMIVSGGQPRRRRTLLGTRPIHLHKPSLLRGRITLRSTPAKTTLGPFLLQRTPRPPPPAGPSPTPDVGIPRHGESEQGGGRLTTQPEGPDTVRHRFQGHISSDLTPSSRVRYGVGRTHEVPVFDSSQTPRTLVLGTSRTGGRPPSRPSPLDDPVLPHWREVLSGVTPTLPDVSRPLSSQYWVHPGTSTRPATLTQVDLYETHSASVATLPIFAGHDPPRSPVSPTATVSSDRV